MMYRIVRSLLLVVVVSSICGVLAKLYGYDFVEIFTLTLVLQVILSYCVNTIVTSYLTIRNKKLENDRLSLFAQQSADLKCAFCEDVSVVPIRLDRDNEYICPNCGSRNSVYLNITVARATTPLNVKNFTTTNINDEKIIAMDKLK